MQPVPMSVLGIPLAFVFLATSAVWSGETHDRHTTATLVAHRCGVDVDFSFRTRPCVSLLAPRIQTMKMGNDPIAVRFCSSLRLVSGLDDSTTGAFLTDADPAFCD
jgi:hypothetical protein